MIKARLKRHRVTIQTPTATQDEAGQPIVAWSTFYASEPAEFTPTGGIESMRGKQLEAGTKGIFRVNYRAGYTTQMRVVHNGTNYGITHVNPVDGLRYEIELMVSQS